MLGALGRWPARRVASVLVVLSATLTGRAYLRSWQGSAPAARRPFYQDGDRFWRMPECYIRGNTVKYIRIPDEVRCVERARASRAVRSCTALEANGATVRLAPWPGALLKQIIDIVKKETQRRQQDASARGGRGGGFNTAGAGPGRGGYQGGGGGGGYQGGGGTCSAQVVGRTG